MTDKVNLLSCQFDSKDYFFNALLVRNWYKHRSVYLNSKHPKDTDLHLDLFGQNS